MATETALNATGVSFTFEKPLAPGRSAATTSRPVALSTEDKAALDAMGTTADAAWSGTGNATLIAVQKASYLASQSSTPVPIEQPSDVIAFTPVLDTVAYAAGDVLFATASIADAVRANDLRSLLQSLVVIDKDDQKLGFDIHFFSANVTSGAINAAPTISDADAGNFLGTVTVAVADYKDLGGVSVACIKNIGLLLEAASGAWIIYAFGVTAGAPTHTASGLVLRFGMLWT